MISTQRRTARKTSAIVTLLLGLAAFCPAPIKDIRSKDHEIPQHSAAQRESELRFNGNMGVVGSVPEKTNQDGTAPDPTAGDAKAGSIIAVRPIVSDPAALRSLTKANARVQEQQDGQGFPWLAGLVAFLGAFGLFQGARLWLLKKGPAPHRAARTGY